MIETSLNQVLAGALSVGAQAIVGLVIMVAAAVFIVHAIWMGRRR